MPGIVLGTNYLESPIEKAGTDGIRQSDSFSQMREQTMEQHQVTWMPNYPNDQLCTNLLSCHPKPPDKATFVV